jgi:hypothetical protein
MKFFQNLSGEDFKEFIGTLILLLSMTYLFLPTEYTDPSIRGSMLTLLGVIVKHYFDRVTKVKTE